MQPITALHRMDKGSSPSVMKTSTESKRWLPTCRVEPGDYMKATVRRGSSIYEQTAPPDTQVAAMPDSGRVHPC